MMWWSDTGWGSWMLMGVLMVLFWGAAIALALWVVRRGRFEVRGGGAPMSVDRADHVLEERFARGEIDEAQFTRTRAVLHSRDGSA